MANLENLTSASELTQYRTDNTVDPDEQNDNEGAVRAKLNVVIAALNDGSISETGKARTFTATQTYSSGIKVDDIQSTTGSANIVVTNGTLKLGGTATNLTAATQLYVQQQITGAGSITVPLSYGDVQSSNFTAVSGFLYLIDCSSNTVTATLPASPSNGDVVGFVNYNGSFTTNDFTVGRNSKEIQDVAEDMTASTAYARIYLVYDSSEGSWYLT